MSEEDKQDAVQKEEQKPVAAIGFLGWPAIVALLVFALDQISKMIIDHVYEEGSSINIIPGFFELVHVRNRGCAWGMFSDHTWVLALFSALVFILLIFFFRKLCGNSRLLAFAMGLLQGGIVGNMIDRGIRGSVIDFIDWHIGTHHWPAFNIADTAICIAAGLMILQSFLADKEKQAK